MILNSGMYRIDEAAHIIAGSCYIAGDIKDADGVLTVAQVLLCSRDTGAIAGSATSDTSGSFRIQVVAASGNPITSPTAKVHIIGRAMEPVGQNADIDDYVTMIQVT